MTVPDSVAQTLATRYSSPGVRSPGSTKLIKPISSTLQIQDSGSDFFAPSIASTTKTCSFCMTDSVRASNVLIQTFQNNDGTSIIESPSKMLKLSCGPVKVHSYRDTQVSEDVVYQGKWQRCKPKAITRKKYILFSPAKSRTNALVTHVCTKKSKEILKEKKVISKEKVNRKRQEKKEMEAEPKKTPQIPKVKLRKLIQEEKCAEIKKPRVSKSGVKIPSKPKGIPRPVKTLTKVIKKTILRYSIVFLSIKIV